jgi:hypothetical protein
MIIPGLESFDLLLPASERRNLQKSHKNNYLQCARQYVTVEEEVIKHRKGMRDHRVKGKTQAAHE